MTGSSVLVIDSNAHKIKRIYDLLSGHGYNVLTADNIIEAEKQISLRRFDVIICDVVFDGEERLDILAIIRSLTDTPVIVWSAKDSIEDKIRTYAEGCDDHISDSIDLKEFELRIASLIKRSMKQSDLFVEFAPLSINIKTRDVSAAGVQVNLTNREFEILYFLSETPNKTISIQDIYSRVWGNDTPCDSHLVMVNISYIRKKLGKVLPEVDFIRTVWGVGYSFCYPPIQSKKQK